MGIGRKSALILRNCYHFRININLKSIEENALKEQLNILADLLAEGVPVISGAGFFNIDLAMLFKLLHGIVSYVIVIYQIGGK